ncbi:MAG: hypothetical protein GDA35_06095 [Hyphomonadaceae bacterium]|nr:hypothetical protein [Hyphomonadaceae bacterium]
MVALQIFNPLPPVCFGLLLPNYFSPDLPVVTQFLIMLVTVTASELLGLTIHAYGATGIRRILQPPRQAHYFNIALGVIMIISGVWTLTVTT